MADKQSLAGRGKSSRANGCPRVLVRWCVGVCVCVCVCVRARAGLAAAVFVSSERCTTRPPLFSSDSAPRSQYKRMGVAPGFLNLMYNQRPLCPWLHGGAGHVVCADWVTRACLGPRGSPGLLSMCFNRHSIARFPWTACGVGRTAARGCWCVGVCVCVCVCVRVCVRALQLYLRQFGRCTTRPL